MDYFIEDIKEMIENEENRRGLEREIRETDLEEIWEEVYMTSAPGEDGLTYGALRFLCEDSRIKKVYIEAMNEAINEAESNQ